MNDFVKILLTPEEIAQRVAELGKQITQDYQDKDLILVGILKGGIVFFSDLMRQIKIPVHVDFMAVSSYGDSQESSGVVRIMKDLDMTIEGRNVLIVEDIVDTGLTLTYLKEILYSRKPNDVKVAALLDNLSRRQVDITPDYLGFSIPDEFVVGYGLDFAEQYRHLPFVAVLAPQAYQA